MGDPGNDGAEPGAEGAFPLKALRKVMWVCENTGWSILVFVFQLLCSEFPGRGSVDQEEVDSCLWPWS